MSHERSDGVAARGLRGGELLERLLSVDPIDRDAWVDALLGLPEEPEETPLPSGGVPYIPCGTDEILAAVRELPLRPADVLVDLGSGLGKVAMLAHLLTGARAHGIELQAPLVKSARACAAALGLTGVTFTEGDARDAALEGTVFFLYAPFNGPMLAAVLRRLEALAQKQRLVICAVDLELPGQSWLRPRAVEHPALAVYSSR